jgi:hypothetical protein
MLKMSYDKFHGMMPKGHILTGIKICEKAETWMSLPRLEDLNFRRKNN